MHQERHVSAASANKRTTIAKDNTIVQIVDDNAVVKFAFSSVVDLTDDAWLLVFDYLEDKTRIARACRRWRDLARISWKSTTRLSFDSMFKCKRGCLDNQLEVILQQCGTRLRCLDLSSAPGYLTPRALDLMIGLYCTSLQELNLCGVPLTNALLKSLAGRLPRLRSLTLTCSEGLERYGLREALKILRSLKTLNVTGSGEITGEFFSQAPQSLTEVFAECCYNLTDRGVRFLTERCPNLETLDISGCCILTGQSFTDLVTNCPRLKRFKMHFVFNIALQTSNFLTLSNLPLLEELHVDRFRAVTNEVLYELGRNCPLLRSISCIYSNRLTDAAISNLSPCRHLESINLSSCQHITDEGLFQLSSAHSELKKVHLAYCQGITDVGVGNILSAHPNLLELDLHASYQLSDRLLPVLESSLKRRQHAEPLKISLTETPIDSSVIAKNTNCILYRFSRKLTYY